MIAQKYRLPEAQVAQHLQSGRLRVKSNVDEPTAWKFAAELQTMGAVCAIVDAATNASLAMPPPPRAAAPPPPPPTPPPSTPSAKYESGLAAAFTPQSGQQDISLGALDAGGLGGPIALAALDGADEAVFEPTSLAGSSAPAPGSALPVVPPLDLDDEPEPLPRPAAKLPAPRPAPPATPAAPPRAHAGPPPDAFASPDETGREAPLELGDSPAKPSRPATVAKPPPPAPSDPRFAPPDQMAAGAIGTQEKRTGPVNEAWRSKMPATSGSWKGDLIASQPLGPALETEGTPASAPRAPPPEGGPLAKYFYGKERHRLVVGLFFGLLLGYVPATLYAGYAEDARFADIRKHVDQAQTPPPSSPKAWELLSAPGGLRDAATHQLERTRTRIQLETLVVWVLAGGGLGWVWFRKLT